MNIHTLWFCQDCTVAHCNGDYSGMSDSRALRVDKGLSQLSRDYPLITLDVHDAATALTKSARP